MRFDEFKTPRQTFFVMHAVGLKTGNHFSAAWLKKAEGHLKDMFKTNATGNCAAQVYLYRNINQHALKKQKSGRNRGQDCDRTRAVGTGPQKVTNSSCYPFFKNTDGTVKPVFNHYRKFFQTYLCKYMKADKTNGRKFSILP